MDPLHPQRSVPVEVEVISKHELIFSFLQGMLSYTKTKPVTQSDSTINYGTFGKKSPFSQMHFENNNKFFTLTRLEKVIELSHWGNITIEETIDLLHTGALLKGLQ